MILKSFHELIFHLYIFFGEMSFVSVALFLIGLYVDITIEFQKLFVYQIS